MAPEWGGSGYNVCVGTCSLSQFLLHVVGLLGPVMQFTPQPIKAQPWEPPSLHKTQGQISPQPAYYAGGHPATMIFYKLFV